jgi:hypothetical protein
MLDVTGVIGAEGAGCMEGLSAGVLQDTRIRTIQTSIIFVLMFFIVASPLLFDYDDKAWRVFYQNRLRMRG